MVKVAIIGIQGVPAHYGGFESLVENLLDQNCPKKVEYTIFCSSNVYKDKIKNYKGACLKYIPMHANGIHSIPYDIISMCRSLKGYDAILILGVSGCTFIPILKNLTHAKIIVNIDGLEYKRQKWGNVARWYLKQAEALAVKYSDIVVADNKGIQEYVKEHYNKESTLIAYGGDQAVIPVTEDFKNEVLEKYGVTPGNYSITVCRIEPENNPEIILKAFAKSNRRLLFVGNWNHSDWSKHLKKKYSTYPFISLIDSIYDLDVLSVLRANTKLYIHGHSAGGTNPSLVEAMHFANPIAAWDVVYNRETTEGKAYYFRTPEELIGISRRDDLNGSLMKKIAEEKYVWKKIAEQYCDLFIPKNIRDCF